MTIPMPFLRQPRVPRRPTSRARRAAGDEAETTADDGPAAGCGWFDSSHDLRTGLVVCEHDTLSTLAPTTPLAHWLELHRATWRPAPAA